MRVLLQTESFYSLSTDHTRTLLFASLILFILGSCATQEPIPAPIVEPAPVITSQDEKLRKEIAHLKKLLAEKDQLIKNQQIRQQNQARALQEVNKEATRAQVKLHRLATKPSTASAIAETEVALEHLKQVKIPVSDQILLTQAQQLTETASALFSKDQYASAMNYVAQAKHLIELITNPNRKKESNDNGMLLEFHTPIKLHTKANVNLRNAPNTQSKIISTLKRSTAVTANASQGTWLRVQVDQKQGWILNTGLEAEKN
ncbi:SH3 domain-containing protein [Nitrosomonas sp.]|uniref:SH3 domain-containing protein n=1 Tax=Nitrosomonas sp. TaxID=42353 RepID=UPI0025E3C5F6|nr:SH3 domain-containing protein [Nitrosomonas sp.]